MKYETQAYFPVNPPKIMDDPDEFEEQPEPNNPPKAEDEQVPNDNSGDAVNEDDE